MSESDEDLAALVAELVGALQELQRELGPRNRRRPPRPPTPGELARFTSEVAIPGLVLLLETNVRALRLLQRALRMAEGRDPAERDRRLADRAAAASGETLSRLDDVLAELQAAVEGRPTDDDARELLAEARQLREEVQRRLDERIENGVPADQEADAEPDDGTGVEVDVEAELDAIRDELDDTDDGDS